MSEIYTWIRNIVIYMIINTIIMNLLGNSSYKKYVSIVSGMILVLIVVSPLMKLMKLDDNLDYFLQSNNFAVETSDFKNDLRQMEQKQRDAVLKEYKDKIKTQVKKLLLKEGVDLKNLELTVDQDTGSDTYGEILKMNITASVEKKEEDTSGRLAAVDKIEITEIDFNQKDEKKNTAKVPSPMEINIKNNIHHLKYN